MVLQRPRAWRLVVCPAQHFEQSLQPLLQRASRTAHPYPHPPPRQGTGRPSSMMHWDEASGRAPGEHPPTQPGLRLAESPQTGAWLASYGHAPEQPSPLECLQRQQICVSGTASISRVLQWPLLINYPVPTPTQATNLRVKEPSWIQVLTFSHAICHLHSSQLCSYLPTSDQLLCLDEDHSPSGASHSHFPPALPCSHEVNLFCSQASPRATHPAHLTLAHLTKYVTCSPTVAALQPLLVSQSWGLDTCYSLLPPPPPPWLDLFYLNFS